MTSPARQKLLHIHIPHVSNYDVSARLQETIVARFLASKPPSNTSAPPPCIITAQFQPVYTCGRREVNKVSQKQQQHLRANGRAEFVQALRGGQTTFHGPGQLVAYPILDLRTHKLSPRTYVCLLEKSIIATCASYGIKATTTEHTGVWTSSEDKIAAVGVHMRRHITSHGIALNVNTNVWWFDRIVACGLEGKKTTSFEKQGVQGKDVEEVGKAFVQEVVDRLEGVDRVEAVTAEDLQRITTV